MTTLTSQRTRIVRANGIDHHYVEAGSPDAPALVLLHGGLVSTSSVWDDAEIAYNAHLDHLAERFHVIAPDARGSARTQRTSARLSVSLLADDVAAIVAALGLQRPAVAGFSLGGTVATVFAIRHPGVARAIVNDAGYDVLDPEAPVYAMGRQIFGGSPDATAADPEAAVAAMAHAPTPRMRQMFERMQLDQDEAGGEGAWRDYLQGFFELVTVWPGYTVEDLAQITEPTLVLVGDRDMFCAVEDGVRAFRGLAHGELAVVPATEHSITSQKISLMEDFLTR
ncbi:MAG TPA: alpha/beta hydrolase [Nocardioidaceae bacterium]|nr:alpha/beta hydrolase [Nocardioidaceae bacterium]